MLADLVQHDAGQYLACNTEEDDPVDLRWLSQDVRSPLFLYRWMLLVSLCPEHLKQLGKVSDEYFTTCLEYLSYIITRHQDLGDILDTRALRGADCWTNHVLLRCKAHFAIHTTMQKKASYIKSNLH